MSDMRSRSHSKGEVDYRVIHRVAPYLWPAGEREARVRVVGAMLALIFAKIATVLTPVGFMYAVDGLAEGAPAPETWLMAPVALVLFYGFARIA